MQSLVEILSVQFKHFRSLFPGDSCEVGIASRWLLAGGIYNSPETESAILDPPNRFGTSSRIQVDVFINTVLDPEPASDFFRKTPSELLLRVKTHSAL